MAVHREGRLVACLHMNSDGLVRFKTPPAKDGTITLVTLRPPQPPKEP